ncbi:hypothetical protein C8R47DRAFT_1080837 [Mycena vitilis]|nr:hypothetical protein C8R47DRAFT_1080837 [Mycena vitilis]
MNGESWIHTDSERPPDARVKQSRFTVQFLLGPFKHNWTTLKRGEKSSRDQGPTGERSKRFAQALTYGQNTILDAGTGNQDGDGELNIRRNMRGGWGRGSRKEAWGRKGVETDQRAHRCPGLAITVILALLLIWNRDAFKYANLAAAISTTTYNEYVLNLSCEPGQRVMVTPFHYYSVVYRCALNGSNRSKVILWYASFIAEGSKPEIEVCNFNGEGQRIA